MTHTRNLGCTGNTQRRNRRPGAETTKRFIKRSVVSSNNKSWRVLSNSLLLQQAVCVRCQSPHPPVSTASANTRILHCQVQFSRLPNGKLSEFLVLLLRRTFQVSVTDSHVGLCPTSGLEKAADTAPRLRTKLTLVQSSRRPALPDQVHHLDPHEPAHLVAGELQPRQL